MSNDKKQQNISNQFKQEKVKEFLLYPIIKPKRKNKIIIDDINNIQTGQKYYSGLDCDMSDIAVEFYKIIYDKEILKGRYIADNNFAGDTMCSFNTVANDVAKHIPGMGKTKKQRKGQSQGIWPKYLQDYFEYYHCLANFWILPKDVGRTSKNKYSKSKRGIDDYMDNFLLFMSIENNFDGFINKYSRYGDFFGKKFEDFCDKQFLVGSYIKNNQIVSFSNIDNLDNRIKIMRELIKERADCISKSKYCDQLYDLYNRYNNKL